jgi:hypothetical protein
MPIFSGAEAHQWFVDWIDANPEGFVINRKGLADMVLHRASCGHFKPYDWANQTSNLKACSLDRSKLEGGAEVETFDQLRTCNNCL